MLLSPLLMVFIVSLRVCVSVSGSGYRGQPGHSRRYRPCQLARQRGYCIPRVHILTSFLLKIGEKLYYALYLLAFYLSFYATHYLIAETFCRRGISKLVRLETFNFLQTRQTIRTTSGTADVYGQKCITYHQVTACLFAYLSHKKYLDNNNNSAWLLVPDFPGPGLW